MRLRFSRLRCRRNNRALQRKACLDYLGLLAQQVNRGLRVHQAPMALIASNSPPPIRSSLPVPGLEAAKHKDADPVLVPSNNQGTDSYSAPVLTHLSVKIHAASLAESSVSSVLSFSCLPGVSCSVSVMSDALS